MAKIPHERYDISMDEAAKTLWKRKNAGNSELPMLLVDGARPGSVEDLENAVEYGELRQYLRLDEGPARGWRLITFERRSEERGFEKAHALM